MVIVWNGAVVVPLAAFGTNQGCPHQKARQKRDSKVDENASGDFGNGHVHHGSGESEFGRQHGDEYPCIERVKEHLDERVECDQTSGILGIENITTMVNSNAINVSGLTRGTVWFRAARELQGSLSFLSVYYRGGFIRRLPPALPAVWPAAPACKNEASPAITRDTSYIVLAGPSHQYTRGAAPRQVRKVGRAHNSAGSNEGT
jgi:hypothetical protein